MYLQFWRFDYLIFRSKEKLSSFLAGKFDDYYVLVCLVNAGQTASNYNDQGASDFA